MMLRSSSTPVLGSLLSSSETTPNLHLTNSIKVSSGTFRNIPKCTFRRAQSEANLPQGLHNSDRFAATDSVSESVDVGSPQLGKMYLAAGTGVPSDAGGSCRPVDFGDNDGMEEHYKKMLEQSPHNSLLLTNYAQFLHQEKGDIVRAEEYYSRAILADPEDGEILCRYANLIREFHHDKQRANAYFERAVQAASLNSHIHASYASFLWDTEDEDEDEEDNRVL